MTSPGIGTRVILFAPLLPLSARAEMRFEHHYSIPRDDPKKSWVRHDIGPGVHAGLPVGDIDGDGDLDICSKLWDPRPDNGNGGTEPRGLSGEHRRVEDLTTCHPEGSGSDLRDLGKQMTLNSDPRSLLAARVGMTVAPAHP